MKRVLGLIVSILLLSLRLSAQTEVQTSVEEVPSTKGPWSLTVNLSPLFKFNGSFEVGIGYDVANQLSTEFFYAHNKMFNKTFSGIVRIDSATTANALGLRLNFFPFSDVKEGGFYTSAAVSKMNLKTNISASVMGNSKSTRLEDQHLGQRILLGYQFKPKNTDDRLNITSRVGVGYGNGDDYGIREGWQQYEIRHSVQFEGTFVITYL